MLLQRSVSFYRSFFAIVIATTLLVCVAGAQQGDLLLPGVTYVCGGEHMFIENCNGRDTSDSATCMVGHPDHVQPNGLMKYTYEQRGALKKLFPTCTQPSARQVAAAQAFQKKQQDTYNANEKKANDQLEAMSHPPMPGQPAPPKTPEEREMRRCVSSGRLPASCTGNQLLGAFSSMFNQAISSIMPGAAKESGPQGGPVLAGVFEGAGHWRLDFVDGGVLVNCADLAPNQEAYSFDLKTGRAVLTVATTPRPLVLTLHGSETITGPPGPVTIDGVINAGMSGGGGGGGDAHSGYTDKNGGTLTDFQAQHTSEVYKNGQRVYSPVAGGGDAHVVFAKKRVTCPAISLSSKGASTGMQTMQTDLLKGMFSDGDKGAPTPPGIRMQGIYAASTGFSLEFFPESVILGCGPDAARAYPYTVVADGTKAYIKIDAPDHPLNVAFGAGNTLEPGPGPYQVHGRVATGSNDNGDFTFAPNEQTCSLAALTVSKTIPSSGGVSAAAAVAGGGAPSNNGGTMSTPAAPLGNATLTVSSGLAPVAGSPNPLAGRPLVLLRDSYANLLAKGGVVVPAGMSAYKYAGVACGTPANADCAKISAAIKAGAISGARADGNGSGTLPGVPAGTYYLMISARYNNQALVWGYAVQLKAGPNAVRLEQRGAVPAN